jgi:hypothetical protein
MDRPSRISDFINSHPKYSWKLILMVICLFWQSSLLITGILTYWLLARLLKIQWWLLLIVGISTASMYFYTHSFYPFLAFLHGTFFINRTCWNFILHGHLSDALVWIYHSGFDVVLGFSVLLAGIFSTLDLIPEKFHAKAFKELEAGKSQVPQEVTKDNIKVAFKNLEKKVFDGTLLGISKFTGREVMIADAVVNQVVLVLGTTGGGKTITLRRFYERAIQSNQPLIIVDGKPDEENIAWLRSAALKANKVFMGFNCENHLHYDCLANGGFTELKDKIICLKDEWSSDYYRSIAEDYLQTTLEVLLELGNPFDLHKVTECLDYTELVLMARETANKELMKRVQKLRNYDMKDITGLQAHLNLLINSEMGHYFRNDESTFNLRDAIEENALVYFALPALQFPSFAKVLGKLVINDLKAVISNKVDKKVFTVFDEFSVFVSEQVRNLVNMGRGKGIHAVFGTQGLAELKEVSPTLMEQILNCVNTLICHRVNDAVSIQGVTEWIGTRNSFAVTAQLDLQRSVADSGSVRSTKEYIVHPDSIKQDLYVGEAFFITKVGGFKTDKIKVKLS